MTKWTYLFVFDENKLSYDQAKDFIDSCPDIFNWMSVWPNCFILVSPSSATALSNVIEKGLTKKQSRYVVIDTKTDRNGWLPKAAWELMKDPKAAWED